MRSVSDSFDLVGPLKLNDKDSPYSSKIYINDSGLDSSRFYLTFTKYHGIGRLHSSLHDIKTEAPNS